LLAYAVHVTGVAEVLSLCVVMSSSGWFGNEAGLKSATPSKPLDQSGGSVFRIKLRAARVNEIAPPGQL